MSSGHGIDILFPPLHLFLSLALSRVPNSAELTVALRAAPATLLLSCGNGTESCFGLVDGYADSVGPTEFDSGCPPMVGRSAVVTSIAHADVLC
jgi:hypothetical protein